MKKLSRNSGETLGDPLAPTQRGDRFLTTQSLQNGADCLFSTMLLVKTVFSGHGIRIRRPDVSRR